MGGIKGTSGPLKFCEASLVFGNIISEYKKDSLVPWKDCGMQMYATPLKQLWSFLML